MSPEIRVVKGNRDIVKSRQLQAVRLPERSRPLPLSALGLSIVALLSAAVARQLWPEAVTGAAAAAWLLALIPLFVLTYYKGWGIAAVVLATAMTLLVAIEVAMAGGLRGENLDWRPLSFVMLALIAISFVLGAMTQWHLKQKDQATNLAYSDLLTGLPNRRLLDFFLNRHFAAAVRGRSLAVALFDLDDFSSYTRRHGRRAADEALRIIARIVDKHTRTMDLSGRFAEARFLAIFPGGTPADAFQYAVRVRKEVEGCKEFRHGGLTVSAGVAGYSFEMVEERQLLDAASQALYAAKGAGRNRVMVRAEHMDDPTHTEPENAARYGRRVPVAMPGPPGADQYDDESIEA
jgi:diguanylate cyclase (GGDEF)-like protein